MRRRILNLSVLVTALAVLAAGLAGCKDKPGNDSPNPPGGEAPHFLGVPAPHRVL